MPWLSINPDFIKEPTRVSVQNRMAVYQDSYRFRMSDSVIADYPRVQKLLSEEEFKDLVTSFIYSHFSRFTNLAEYSQEFPAYVAKQFPSLYVPALQDWYEIVSSRNQKPPETQILSAKDVDCGVPSRLKVFPSTLTYRTPENYQILNLISKCLDRLPLNQKMAFTLKEVEDETTESICQLLDLTVSNLGVLLFRARNQLRECIEFKSKGGT